MQRLVVKKFGDEKVYTNKRFYFSVLSNFSVEVKMIYNYGFDLITQKLKQLISDYKERLTQELQEIEEWEKTEFKRTEENTQNDT